MEGVGMDVWRGERERAPRDRHQFTVLSCRPSPSLSTPTRVLPPPLLSVGRLLRILGRTEINSELPNYFSPCQQGAAPDAGGYGGSETVQ